MKTKTEIIDETIEYYANHHRGIWERPPLSTSCHYWHKGDMCAVGRCMIDPKDFENDLGSEGSIDEIGCVVAMRDDVLHDEWLDEYLKPEYRGHSLEFWSDLQDFHDDNIMWERTDEGWCLSEEGQADAERLRRQYMS